MSMLHIWGPAKPEQMGLQSTFVAAVNLSVKFAWSTGLRKSQTSGGCTGFHTWQH